MSLQKFCQKPLIHIENTATVQNAARLMKLHGVGTIIVVNNATDLLPVGIITDRDILTQIIAEGMPSSTPIHLVMSSPTTCVAVDADLARVASVMQQEAVRRVIVVDDSGRARGMISIDDLMPELAHQIYDLGSIMDKQVYKESLRDAPTRRNLF